MKEKYAKAAFGFGFTSFNYLLYNLLFTTKEESKFDRCVITENSGLFSCFSYYNLVLRNSLLLHSQDAKRTLIVKQPFWLDSVHPSRLDSEWGQNIREYPLFIREKILAICPEAEAQERLTFRQQKELRQAVTEELRQKENSCQIIEGTCTAINMLQFRIERISTHDEHLFPLYPYRHSTEILTEKTILESDPALETNEVIRFLIDGKKYDFGISKEVKLYNFSTVANFPATIKKQNNNENLPPQTKIYTYNQEDEPGSIILFGGGPSAVWIAEQAPYSQVNVVVRDKTRGLPTNTVRNENINLDHVKLLLNDELDVLTINQYRQDPHSSEFDHKKRNEAIKEYLKLNQLDLKTLESNFIFLFNKENNEIVSAGLAYNSMGYKPNLDLVSQLPSSLVKNIHFNFNDKYYAPKSLPAGALFGRHNHQFRNLTPEGTPAIAHVDLEAMLLREQDKIVLEKQLSVNSAFIEHLCAKIKKLESSPHNPKKFLIDEYMEWSGKKEIKNLTVSCEEFKKNVDKLFEDREKLFQTGMSNHSFPK